MIPSGYRTICCYTLILALAMWGGVSLVWADQQSQSSSIQPIAPIGTPGEYSDPLEPVVTQHDSRGGPEIPEPLTVTLVASGLAVLLGRQSARR